MQIQINGKPSFSKKGAHAQVTILIGEGRNKRSVTRHIGLVGSSWIGFNPDPRAVSLNEQYEAELAEAKAELMSAEAALGTLRKRLPELETIETEVLCTAASEMLEVLIRTAELEVYAAQFLVDDAKAKLAIVQRDVPLEVEFIGEDL